MKPTEKTVGFCFWMQDEMKIDLRLGDCLEVLKSIPDNSVDAVVCDPPYELGFMGKKWDNTGIAYNVNVWIEVLRVLKPGGHLLAFGGSRTYHRMAVAIEDAGFEVREMIEWVYSQGFPKSHSISKAIDRMAGAEREVVGMKEKDGGGRAASSHEGWQRPWMNEEGAREKVFQITAPATPAAAQWEGWGTALKPAHEPICVARKPLAEKTVAENVLKWGTGGLNIDGCRVGAELVNTHVSLARNAMPDTNKDARILCRLGKNTENSEYRAGRFPANLIHDGSDEVLAGFPETSGRGGHFPKRLASKAVNNPIKFTSPHTQEERYISDTGSAARFFYCAKASKKDRDEGCEGLDEQTLQAYGDFAGTPEHGRKQNVRARNHHPTVKPTALMRYLCRLVTPPNGVVLDPFMGSGSTGKGAALEGFDFIGIEKEAEYFEIAKARIAAAQNKPKQEDMIG
jgi:DNA modification methylase